MADPHDTRRWSEAIEGRHALAPPGGRVRVGVLPGEGIGPEVIGATLTVLDAVAEARGLEFALTERKPSAGHPELAEAEVEFCRDTFAAGGAVLAGPHGGRWVYELRRRFDLFCKLSPVRPPVEIGRIDSPISPSALEGVDLLLVREQSGGVYQGSWGESLTRDGGRLAEHSFSYRQDEVRRILEVGATLARWRRGRLAVTVKDGGIPSISKLWRDCAAEIAGDGLDLEVLDADHAVYRLLRHPRDLDVVVASNLFGDMLSDAAGALLGSRGITHAASYDSARGAVYQTNHGAAHDLAGSDRANPAGQILAAAMMLRESFGLVDEAAMIERALAGAWAAGWRTADVAEPGSQVIGTREMGERVADRVGEASQASDVEADAARR
jgi:3-isopropylmalate dehydrogenase